MTYNELLKGFAEKLGGKVDLTPDDAGAVALDIDEMSLTILGLEELGQVVLTGVIGEPPPEDRMEKLYRVMLEANHNFGGTFGATLSINPTDGKASLCRVLSLDLLDGDKFFGEVEHFVNTLETWRKIVVNYRAAAGEPAAETEPSAFGGMGGFMQV